jgi:hypothetical protein
MREPVHQTAERTGPPSTPIWRTKCGLVIDTKYDKRSRVSSWPTDITCTDCEPSQQPTP